MGVLVYKSVCVLLLVCLCRCVWVWVWVSDGRIAKWLPACAHIPCENKEILVIFKTMSLGRYKIAANSDWRGVFVAAGARSDEINRFPHIHRFLTGDMRKPRKPLSSRT